MLRFALLMLMFAAACAGPARNCTSANCPGCCDGHDTCQPGTTFQNCGTGAEICFSCGNGEQCSGTACVPATGPCGLMNCAGCCDANNKCQSGAADNACGRNATACKDCLDAGATYTCESGACIP